MGHWTGQTCSGHTAATKFQAPAVPIISEIPPTWSQVASPTLTPGLPQHTQDATSLRLPMSSCPFPCIWADLSGHTHVLHVYVFTLRKLTDTFLWRLKVLCDSPQTGKRPA